MIELQQAEWITLRASLRRLSLLPSLNSCLCSTGECSGSGGKDRVPLSDAAYLGPGNRSRFFVQARQAERLYDWREGSALRRARRRASRTDLESLGGAEAATG